MATLPPMVENSQLAGSGEYQSRASAAAAAEVRVDDAGLDGRGEVGVVDGEDRGHPLERDDEAAVDRVGAARQPGAGAARDDRHAVARRRAHRGLDLARRPRPHERGGHPDLEQPGRRVVAPVGLQHVRVGLDGTGAAQVVQQARGRDAHRSASW